MFLVPGCVLKKWSKDPAFIRWLLEREYAEERNGKVVPFLTAGTILYMYEVFVSPRPAVRDDVARTPRGLLNQEALAAPIDDVSQG